MKVAELDGANLDAAVAKAEGHEYEVQGDRVVATRLNWKTPITTRLVFSPSTSWSLGGPIIERQQISLASADSMHPLNCWGARIPGTLDGMEPAASFGPTPLVAAMRALVMSKFGEEVDLP